MCTECGGLYIACMHCGLALYTFILTNYFQHGSVDCTLDQRVEGYIVLDRGNKMEAWLTHLVQYNTLRN